jgi:hypothetical protein
LNTPLVDRLKVSIGIWMMEATMRLFTRALLVAPLLAAGLVATQPAHAYWRGGGYHGGYHGGYGGYHHGYGGGAFLGGLAAGALVGGVVAGALAPPVYYAPPPPVYYAPPPVYYAPPPY